MYEGATGTFIESADTPRTLLETDAPTFKITQVNTAESVGEAEEAEREDSESINDSSIKTDETSPQASEGEV